MRLGTAARTVVVVTFLLSVGAWGTAGAQELGVPKEPKLDTEPQQLDMQWLWGEVVSVNAQKNELLVKYLDYETDTEKEMSVAVDNETTYENARAFLDIRPGDIVSIDYTPRRDGTNVAKTVGVEKPETLEAMDEMPALPEDVAAPVE